VGAKPYTFPVFGLRPLRRFARHWDFIDEETHRLIMSYDAYSALPDVAGATLAVTPVVTPEE